MEARKYAHNEGKNQPSETDMSVRISKQEHSAIVVMYSICSKN